MQDKIIQIALIEDETKKVVYGLSDLGNLYKLTKDGWKFIIKSPEKNEQTP